MNFKSTFLFISVSVLSGCGSETPPIHPFYENNELAFKGAFYPVTYKSEDVYLGQDRLFINRKSFAVDCTGKPISRLGGYIYLTESKQALIIDEKTGEPKASLHTTELLETSNAGVEFNIRDAKLLSINGTFTNSKYSTQNQCYKDESM